MIKGVHTMFYWSEPEALRAFIPDKLGFPHTDVGGGWLIFDLPEADMGCHPAEADDAGTHDISFYCDDIERTVAELRARGVEFIDAPTEAATGAPRISECPVGFRLSSISRTTRSSRAASSLWHPSTLCARI